MSRKPSKMHLLPDEQKEFVDSVKKLIIEKGYWTDKFPAIEKIVSSFEPVYKMPQKRLNEIFQEGELVSLPFLIEDSATAAKYLNFFQKRSSDYKRKEIPSSPEKEENDVTGWIRLLIRPDVEQIAYFEKAIKYSEYVYKLYFEKVLNTYRQTCLSSSKNDRVWLRPYAFNPMLHKLKEQNPWLYEVDSTALQNVVHYADKQWIKFFKEIRKNAKNPKLKDFRIEIPKPYESLFGFLTTSSTICYDNKSHSLRIPKLSNAIPVEVNFHFCQEKERIASVFISKEKEGWCAALKFKALKMAPEVLALESISSDDIA